MPVTDPDSVRELIDAAIAAVSVLGGVMAYRSGYGAAQALSDGEPPEIVDERINEGIAEGFQLGAPAGVMTLIIVLWSYSTA